MSDRLRRRLLCKGNQFLTTGKIEKQKATPLPQAAEKRKIHTGFGGVFWRWVFFVFWGVFWSAFSLCIGNSASDPQT